MSVDRATVAIGDQFHLTISAHVDEKIAQLDNLTLPDLAGFDSLGDERRCFAAASGGSDCVETVTLSATIAGPRAIRGAPPLRSSCPNMPESQPEHDPQHDGFSN